jgi:putative FmdB family regulatory protein
MPTYEYRRKDGSVFTIQQRMSEDALTLCPTTGQQVERIISGGGGVIYKGSGWYVKEYKNGGKNGPESSSEAKSTAATSEVKSTTPVDTPAPVTKTVSG